MLKLFLLEKFDFHHQSHKLNSDMLVLLKMVAYGL